MQTAALKHASREELLAALRSFEEQNSALEKEKSSLRKQNETLRQQIDWLRRQQFGATSERLIPQDPRQHSLFEVPEQPPAETTSVKSYERSARKKPTNTDAGSKLRFDDSVPVDVCTVLPKEVEGLSEDEFSVIGEKVTERLIQIPASYRLERTIRKTCKILATGSIHTAPAPDAVIERSFADATFLAGMVTEKFLYHQPIYRQHQRMKASGVHVSRGHLSKLVHRTLELLEPIYQAILSEILCAELISMDETPVKAGRKEKGKMHQGYFWPVFAELQVAFIYSSSRAHRVVSDVLGENCKKLMSDGYSAYERYAEFRENLVHAQCWAHVRRKFFDAREHSPPEAEKALGIIRELFAVEQELENLSDEQILALRRERSMPLVHDFFKEMEVLWHTRMVERSSLLGKAVGYAVSRKEALMQFLFHPDIPLSNNHVERAIRPVALGRKNWLFCWTEVGAKYAAIAFTLIECCKLHGINPWEYLIDVLKRIDTHPAREVHLLTPKYWKENFKR